MSDKMSRFAALGRQLVAALTDRASSSEGLSDAIDLDDTPAYPLARTVQMPTGYGYETGAFSFRMADLQLHGASHLKECASESGADRVRINLTLTDLCLRGRYSVEVKPDPIIDLDTAGNLMDLPPEACRPGMGGADSVPGTLDPQKEEWLNQARVEREKLRATDNGQKLLALHQEHNETYDEVFRTNAALVPLWRAGGATKEMAGDTHGAVQADAVVNSANKIYTGDVTYNSNAFTQQLNVASACLWTDPDFNPMTGPPAESKYVAASKAALSFGKGVGTTTNNTKDTVQELKPSEVHTTVENHDGTLPEVTDDEAAQVAMEAGPGGADADIHLGWVVIDEADRKRLRHLYEATMKQKAEDNSIVGTPLFEGRCEARIDAVEACVELILKEREEGNRVSAVSARVQLPAFELDIDDSAWIGEAGTIARHRLEQMYFIRSLLHGSIVASLQQALLHSVQTEYNATPAARW